MGVEVYELLLIGSAEFHDYHFRCSGRLGPGRRSYVPEALLISDLVLPVLSLGAIASSLSCALPAVAHCVALGQC
jgi:hypothetical protein